MDQRRIGQIRVTWQLAVFIIGLGALPISLAAPVGIMVYGGKPLTRTELTTCLSIAALVVFAMFLAVRSRLDQAAKEPNHNGTPKQAWVLRQVLIGVVLIALLAVTLIAATILRVTVIGAIGCITLGTPGVLIIGRALVPDDSQAV